MSAFPPFNNELTHPPIAYGGEGSGEGGCGGTPLRGLRPPPGPPAWRCALQGAGPSVQPRGRPAGVRRTEGGDLCGAESRTDG